MVTLDLNGHKISRTTVITNNGKLTLKSSVNEDDSLLTTINENVFNNNKNLIIESGNYESNKNVANQSSSNTSTLISGGYLKSTASDTINKSSESLKITGGEIEAIGNNKAINGNVTIEGGYIQGKEYGIYENSSSAKLTFGVEDEIVNTLSPTIISDKEGIYVEAGSFSFFDGIIKGIEESYEGSIIKIEDSYMVTAGVEAIDGVLYKTAYLGPDVDFLQVGDETFNSLKKAINYIDNTVINDKIINSSTEVPRVKI